MSGFTVRFSRNLVHFHENFLYFGTFFALHVIYRVVAATPGRKKQPEQQYSQQLTENWSLELRVTVNQKGCSPAPRLALAGLESYKQRRNYNFTR